MNKLAPKPHQFAAIALFALTCFGLLLYLWLAFGGPSPLKPQGYRFNIDVPQASTLAEQADARISGVKVGKVVHLELGPNNTTRATIQLDAQYAPARSDMKAILRSKTLLGETYVELTPGSKDAPPIIEGGQLASTRVAPSVALDEIFRTFDAQTREDWKRWMVGMAMGYGGRGKDISNAFGDLVPFAENADTITMIARSQSADVKKAISGTATVFDALSRRTGQLQGLIRDADTTFNAIGDSDTALAETFRQFPGFERASRKTLEQLDAFADNASPLLDDLQPAVKQMTPTFNALAETAPNLQGTIDGLGALTSASVRGFPALVSITGELQTIFKDLRSPLRNLNPLLTWVGGYMPEIGAALANVTASSQKFESPPYGLDGDLLRSIRAEAPVNQTALSTYSRRVGANRGNAYPKSGSVGDVAGLSVFNTANCGSGNPVITGDPTPEAPQSMADQLADLGVAVQGSPGDSTAVASPQCQQQGAFSWNGVTSSYPHLTEAPSTR